MTKLSKDSVRTRPKQRPSAKGGGGVEENKVSAHTAKVSVVDEY